MTWDLVLLLPSLLLFASCAISIADYHGKSDKKPSPVVVIQTNKGNVEVELNIVAAPRTVANFLQYMLYKHYDGTIFHRIIRGFMIQGGGFTLHGPEKRTREPIKMEATGLKNEIGTVAMARTNDPDSATSQFFINTANNPFLDFKPVNPGYAVFGKVIKGMDVVKKIETVPTMTQNFYENWPKEEVIIEKIVAKGPEK